MYEMSQPVGDRFLPVVAKLQKEMEEIGIPAETERDIELSVGPTPEATLH
jgi:hypothetical protein